MALCCLPERDEPIPLTIPLHDLSTLLIIPDPPLCFFSTFPVTLSFQRYCYCSSLAVLRRHPGGRPASQQRGRFCDHRPRPAFRSYFIGAANHVYLASSLYTYQSCLDPLFLCVRACVRVFFLQPSAALRLRGGICA